MNHVRIKTDTDNCVHFENPYRDQTLCGLDCSEGDPTIGISALIDTNRKVDCEECINTIMLCKEVSLSEIKRADR
jgi:hypothetical protein